MMIIIIMIMKKKVGRKVIVGTTALLFKVSFCYSFEIFAKNDFICVSLFTSLSHTLKTHTPILLLFSSSSFSSSSATVVMLVFSKSLLSD